MLKVGDLIRYVEIRSRHQLIAGTSDPPINHRTHPIIKFVRRVLVEATSSPVLARSHRHPTGSALTLTFALLLYHNSRNANEFGIN
jgi:hypothetical protein